MRRLENKVSVVTGSGRNIGKAIALLLAKEGCNVVICDVRNMEMDDTVEKIRALGQNAIKIQMDISKKKEVTLAVNQILEKFGKIDIWINNAGLARHAPLVEVSEENWDRVIDVNLKGTFLCMQAVAPHMIERKYGKIINIASIGGLGYTNEKMACYASAKAGVVQLTKVGARELGPYGINVNAIAPGAILTDMTYSVRTKTEVEEWIKHRTKNSVLGRIGKATDIAYCALFLASDEASFITGQVIQVDGGRTDRL